MTPSDVLEGVRGLWWAPLALAGRTEVWDKYVKHPKGASRILDALYGLYIPYEDRTPTGVWGAAVDLVCPEGVTAGQMLRAAQDGFWWPLRFCADTWWADAFEDRPVHAGEFEGLGRVVGRGVPITGGQGWGDRYRRWLDVYVPDLYLQVGRDLSMCSDWFTHTDAQAERLLTAGAAAVAR